MPAALEKHDSDDIKALRSQDLYANLVLYIVDNAGRNDVDFEREGITIDDLNFFSY